jgi:hypothetical protein
MVAELLPNFLNFRRKSLRVGADAPIWHTIGFEGNRLQKRLAGSYFVAFSTYRITIGLQNPQNLPPPSHFFAAILQVRQAARQPPFG